MFWAIEPRKSLPFCGMSMSKPLRSVESFMCVFSYLRYNMALEIFFGLDILILHLDIIDLRQNSLIFNIKFY